MTCSRSISGLPRPSWRACTTRRDGLPPAASTSASMSSCSREPACIAQILAVQLRDDVRRLERAARRARRFDRAGGVAAAAVERRRTAATSCASIVSRNLPSSVTRAPPNASRASLTCQPCHRAARSRAHARARCAACRADSCSAQSEARVLVEALAFRLRAHVDASRELLVQLDRIDVVGARRELPGARLRELQLPAAGHACRRSASTSYCAMVSCSFDSTPLRRALRRRKVRAVDLRSRREVVRHRAAQRAFAGGAA